MRITNNMVSDRVISDLQSQYAQLANTQLSISTGRRVNNPSDDPTASSQERMRLSQLEGIQSAQKSVATSQTWLNQAEASISGVTDVLARAKEIATTGANGSYSQSDRNALANEVDQLIKAAKESLNAKVGSDYIFSGTKSDTPPYSTATGDAYQGDTGAVVRDGGAGTALQNNPSFAALGGTSEPLTAQSVLGNGSASGDGRVLDALTQLAAHLRGGTTADVQALGSSDLTALENNRIAVSNATSAIGAMSNRATAATSRLEDLEDGAKTSIDDLTGVDMAQAITDFSTQSAAYQASLKVGAQIIQPSLLQFLS
ncbi:Flagellar hook-associated protein 3 [Baekduia alba]|uniref:flagellar hook-associated protein FlgL n=1 Tax=Baekduia alba TaxID=2997333 RepID=UPI002340A346|nr:flagellar hook-associated protein FlgL [Baekduia alba]WCB91353.1 Flagellar hook-associated protein 3 [Baekduia alba]